MMKKVELMVFPKRFRMNFNKDSSELKSIIKLNGSRKEMYLSVYDFNDEVVKENIIIDKIFIDFDPEKNDEGEIIDEEKPFENCKKVAKYLKEKGVSFYVRFSGRGFHLYIRTLPHNYEHNINSKIKQYVNDLMNTTDATCDRQVVGDLRRMSRIINTINKRTNLYCIPLTYDALMNCSYDKIKDVAEKKSFSGSDNINYGYAVDLSDVVVQKAHNYIYNKQQNINHSLSNTQIPLPPCLSILLNKPDINYRERFMIIVYARDMGYTVDEVENFIEENLSEEKSFHCLHEENQVQYLFDREDILFPECNSLRNEGFICTEECNGVNLYI